MSTLELVTICDQFKSLLKLEVAECDFKAKRRSNYLTIQVISCIL